YSQQGPDYEGQIRRLRTGDGVYYTKFGARKLAHYVEREIQRSIANRGMPVALPVPADSGPQAPNAKPDGPAQRPLAGPVVPLTAMQGAPEELVGSGRAARAPPPSTTPSRACHPGARRPRLRRDGPRISAGRAAARSTPSRRRLISQVRRRPHLRPHRTLPMRSQPSPPRDNAPRIPLRPIRHQSRSPRSAARVGPIPGIRSAPPSSSKTSFGRTGLS